VVGCCDVAIVQINYPNLKQNTQDSIEKIRGRSHEEGSSHIFMLDDNPLASMPHVYFNKKYLGLRHQNVTVHPPPFAYAGNKGVESCVHQLNNINAVSGSSLIMLASMCHLFGIPSKHFFQGGEEDINSTIPKPTNKFPQFHDSGLKLLVETLDQNIRILHDKIENLSVRISLIETKLSTIDKLQTQLATIATLDISKIDKVLDLLQNIDLKT
jgi:hypothetical protein